MSHQPTVHKKILPDGIPPNPPPVIKPRNTPLSSHRQILRVNQACKTCRKQKMRCEGPDNPPCARCKATGTECVFEKVPKGEGEPTPGPPDRVRDLEQRLDTLQEAQSVTQSMLQELLNEFRHFRGGAHQGGLSVNTEQIAGPSNGPSVPIKRPPDSPMSVFASPTPEASNLPRPSSTTPSLLRRPSSASLNGDEVARKRRRIDVRSLLLDEDGATAWGPPDRTEEVAESKAIDPIEKGLVTEAEARELWQLFFEYCHYHLPLFDTTVDTFESMRARSPLCFCCILTVAAKVRDGSSQPSDVHQKLWNEALEMSKAVIFSGVDGLEKIQAMLLISSWSNSSRGVGWIAAGHAIRFAVELGIQRAVPRLAKRHKDGTLDGEANRLLVTAARLWCATFGFEHQICLGTGRPPMMTGESTIRGARDVFLHNPAALPTDLRFVFACELYTLLRGILEEMRGTEEHQRAMEEQQRPGSSPHTPHTPTSPHASMINIVRDARQRIEQWLEEWLTIIKSRPSSSTLAMCMTATIQSLFAHMTVHARCMGPLRSAADLERASPEVKEVVKYALICAQKCVEICVSTSEYRTRMRYAATHTHSAFGFAGMFLLRMGQYFPEAINYPRAVQSVTLLVDTLSQSPIGGFVQRLKQLLEKQNATSPSPQIPFMPGLTRASSSSKAGSPPQQNWPTPQMQHASPPNPFGAGPATMPAQMTPGDAAMYSGWRVTVSNLQTEEDVLQTADLVHEQFASDL